jgi:hypothetical protein
MPRRCAPDDQDERDPFADKAMEVLTEITSILMRLPDDDARRRIINTVAVFMGYGELRAR